MLNCLRAPVAVSAHISRLITVFYYVLSIITSCYYLIFHCKHETFGFGKLYCTVTLLLSQLSSNRIISLQLAVPIDSEMIYCSIQAYSSLMMSLVLARLFLFIYLLNMGDQQLYKVD